MWSVKNDDESLETAAVAPAREQMVTACSIWASVESHLALKIKLTAWTCMARQPRTAGSQDCAKRRPLVLFSEKSFFDAVFNAVVRPLRAPRAADDADGRVGALTARADGYRTYPHGGSRR